MTKAKMKKERKAKAIALAQTVKAARALRRNNEEEFRELFPSCDVSIKFIWQRFADEQDVESDLFSAACYGTLLRKKDDLAKLIVERMITEGVDLQTHRTHPDYGFTTLMMAAVYCERDVLGIILPLSDTTATTYDGVSALELAREGGMDKNADYIDAFILSKNEAQMFDDIPIPPPRPIKSIDG